MVEQLTLNRITSPRKLSQAELGPNELAWMEAALAMLAESGLKPKKRYRAFFTIIGHVRGTGHESRFQLGVAPMMGHSC